MTFLGPELAVAQGCPGDCDDNGVVTIDEVLTLVRISLGEVSATECLAGDLNSDGFITVEELLAAVNSVLLGCGGNPGPAAGVLYVRQSGGDGNNGRNPAQALRSLTRAAQRAGDRFVIVVGSGTYRETVSIDRAGAKPQGLTFFADRQGRLTGDVPGAVIVDAADAGPAFDIADANSVTVADRVIAPVVDGFTVVNARGAGILVTGGSDVIVQNCEVSGTDGDGILIQGTSSALVFNNLVYNNAGNGITVVQGASGARIVSNTVVENGEFGVSIGNVPQSSAAPLTRNNIIQDNEGEASVKVFAPADQGFTGGFNLVLPDVYDPQRIRRIQDIHDDAQFVDPAAADFRLDAMSPAVNAGAALNDTLTLDRARVTEGVPCFVRNDATCFVTLTDYLTSRTAMGGNGCDRGALDLGFHTPPVTECGG